MKRKEDFSKESGGQPVIGGMDTEPGEMQKKHTLKGIGPRGKARLIYHADGHPWEAHTPIRPKAEDLFEFVDHRAAAGTDTMTLMGFVGGQVVWKTALATPRYNKHPQDEPGRLRLERLWAQGVEPIDVYARRCHEKGMKFLVKFRMNDRHSYGKLPGHHSNMHMGKSIQDHQEWWLNDYPGGFDFTHQGVRDWMFSLAQEVTRKFDIDGLTFNYMRYPYVFEIAESRQKQPILTEFMRRVRRMLDEEGNKKGRKLDFCAIVAPTVEESQNFGLDVPTWIEEEIVDSICPCHFDNTLFNTSYGEFAELTRGKEVYLFPTVHPGISPYLYYAKFMTPPAYRAAARNIYAAGADGISAFNYMCHWGGMSHIYGVNPNNARENYPKALYYLKELRCVSGLEQGDRHYIFLRNRPTPNLPGFLDRHHVMTLSRSEGARAEWTIRCAETFNSGEKAIARLNAVNLLPADEIVLSVNGETIPAGSITRTFHKDGRTDLKEGIKLPAYTTIAFAATAPPFKFLESRLGLTLLRSAEEGSGDITVPEIETAVAAGDGDPLEVMALMEAGSYPQPVETLAGYHADITQVGAELMAGDAVDNASYIGGRYLVDDKETVSAGAQSFVLKEKTEISRVDLCMYRIPEIQASLRLSLRADSNGRPAEKLICSDAAVTFDPWENSEELLVNQLQGYYKFIFKKPLLLEAGTHWMVFEMDPARQPVSSLRYGDPKHPSCFAPVLTLSASKHYPQGRYLRWTGTEWIQVEKDGEPVSAFFGVFGE